MRLPSDAAGPAGSASGTRAARRKVLGLLCAVVLLSGVSAAAFLLQGVAPPTGRPTTGRADRLFDANTLWTASLQVEPDEWDKLEPKGGGFPFGPGPGGPGPGPGGPPVPGGPGGPPPDFGPGTFVAPIFMQQGDEDHDGRLTLNEIRSLADRWFTDWDKDRAGKLSGEQLRDGLNVAMTPQGPPGGPGRPGGAGGPGGPGGMTFEAPEGKRNGIVGMMGMNFDWVRASLEFQGDRYDDIQMRLKGNGTFIQSRGDLKRSFKIKFAKGKASRKVGGLGKLSFHSNVTDASLMNETLAYRMFRDAGVPAPRSTFARVYLTVPGRHDDTYVGLFSIIENPDNDFAVDRFGTKKGVIFKPVAKRMFDYLGDKWEAYRKAYDAKTPMSVEEERRVVDFCRLVSLADDDEFEARLESYLDLDEFSRFMAVTVWLSTFDSILAMDQNFVVYLHPKTKMFQFIPWDLDHSFGQFFPMGTPQQRENLSIHKPWVGEFPFLKRVFAVERFKRLYLARLKEINETLGRPERIHRQVDELAALLRPAVADESPEKLARFDTVVAGKSVGPGGFGPPGGFGGPQAKGPPGGPGQFPGGGPGGPGMFPGGPGGPGAFPGGGPGGFPGGPGGGFGGLSFGKIPPGGKTAAPQSGKTAPGGGPMMGGPMMGGPMTGSPPMGPMMGGPMMGGPMGQPGQPGPSQGQGLPMGGPGIGAPGMGGPPMGMPNMFGDIKPIKGFVTARYPSVRDQLAGTRKGDEIGGMGFGPPGPGGPGKMEPGKPPAGFGPGMFWAPMLMTQFDTNKDNHLSRAELVAGLQRWFRTWDTEKTDSLSEDQIRAGLNKVFMSMAPGPFGPGPGAGPGPDFGPGPGGGPGMGFPFGPMFGPDDESEDEPPAKPQAAKPAAAKGNAKENAAKPAAANDNAKPKAAKDAAPKTSAKQAKTNP